MTRFYKYFFKGLITILPVGVTLYLLFLYWSEDMALVLLRPFIGGFYVPGLGLVLGVLGIVLIGYLVSQKSMSRYMSWI